MPLSMSALDRVTSKIDTNNTKDKKEKKWVDPLIEVVYEFADNTTLNGLKYIAEKGASILERFFWLSTFLLSTVLCIMMVYKSYVKYDTSGVVVTLKEHLVSVNEVAPRHEDIFRNCSWRNKVDCVTKFRPVLTADGVCFTFNILATDEIFRKDSIDHKDKRYFLNTSTPQKGWSLEKNFYSFDNDSFPRRGRANGAREDLCIVLNEVTDRDFICDEQTRPGYKVYLHHPADLPQASLHSYSAQPGKTTSIAIKLDIIDTTEDLSGYTPQMRQCYFPSERYLQFFQKYTSLNCQLECLTNYTIQICGCVSFYMPRNGSTDICKANKRKCIDDALDQYAAEEDLNDGKNSQCECLPSCKDVNYDAEIVLTKLDLKEYYERLNALNNLITDGYDNDEYQDINQTYTNTFGNETVVQLDVESSNVNNFDSETETQTSTNLTQIRIYYRRPRFVAMERSELVGLSQFLADVGGTLGLFLGFSFLTLAEIFYFFTLKLCCTFQRKTSAKKVDKASDTNDV